MDYVWQRKSQEDVINEILMERRRELWGEGFGITDVLRTQKAVERTALSEDEQKMEVDCWQEDGSASAVLGNLADKTSIEYVYNICAYMPLLGLVTFFLPNLKKQKI